MLPRFIKFSLMIYVQLWAIMKLAVMKFLLFTLPWKKYTIYSCKYAHAVTQETNLAAVICRN